MLRCNEVFHAFVVAAAMCHLVAVDARQLSRCLGRPDSVGRLVVFSIRNQTVDMSELSWPPGVPNRKRRPDTTTDTTAFAALVGGIFAGPMGAIGAGLLGSGIGGKAPLEESLREFLDEQDAELVSLRRYGPRVAVLLYEDEDGDFYTLRSEAPARLKGENLEDWLYGDLVRSFNRQR